MAGDFKDAMSKRIKVFIVELINFVDMLPRDNVCTILSKQLVRSGLSIGANFAEARAASSTKDYIQYFGYSLKSANETVYWLEILVESKRCDKQKGDKLRKEANEIANILAASIITLKKKIK